MKIAVLCGGLSPERDVSRVSGSLIANALINKGHDVALADLYLGTDENVPVSDMFGRTPFPACRVEEKEPDLGAVKASAGGREAYIGPGIIELCKAADAVFLALHGSIGENGMLQATLDSFGIKHYTGTGYIGALLSMDKDIAKKMMSGAGVPVPEGIYCNAGSADTAERILNEVGLPCVIKPASCGSSVGVSRVFTKEELDAALASAAKYETSVLAEKLIEGRELTCAVLGGRALPPVEIIPKSGWYDYANKYQSGATTEICPAPLTDEETAEIQRLALAAFGSLRMEMYGRADFILTPSGKFVCLEVNALPGMTPTSLLPQEAAAVGIEYGDLCEMLAEMALKK